MKKLFIILIFMVFAINVYCEYNLEHMYYTGYDWNSWENTEKEYYLIGYKTAMDTVRMGIAVVIQEYDLLVVDDYKLIYNLCSFEDMDDLIIKINLYYVDKTKLNDSVYSAILFIAGKMIES